MDATAVIESGDVFIVNGLLHYFEDSMLFHTVDVVILANKSDSLLETNPYFI